MDFLIPEVRKNFTADKAIQTRIEDLPSAKMNEGSCVRNSLISSGCIVNGQVEDSVIFKQVFIEKGAVIKNSIILNGAYIGEGAYLENCIVEGREMVPEHANYVSKQEPLIIHGLKNDMTALSKMI